VLIAHRGVDTVMLNSPVDVIFALMSIVAFLIAVVIHQFTQATVALWLGDRTAVVDGRLSLNPRTHIEPIGMTLAVILAFLGIPSLGYGRPLRVDTWKMRGGPNTGLVLTSLAGMLANLIVGVLIAIGLHFSVAIPAYSSELATANPYWGRLDEFLIILSVVNIAYFLLNILPIYPLDGFQLLLALLPTSQAITFRRSEQYGPLILLGLIFLLPWIAQLFGLSFLNVAGWISRGAEYIALSIAGVLHQLVFLYFLQRR
jgi:Zn-dependent protease